MYNNISHGFSGIDDTCLVDQPSWMLREANRALDIRIEYTKLMTHFLQSDSWAAFQQALGRQIVTDHGDGWSYLATLERGTLNTRLYAPYGPIIHDRSTLPRALEAIIAAGKERDVTFVRVEPLGMVSATEMKKLGWQKVTYNHLQPEYTQVIDLSRDSEQILADMKPNNRNIYRNFQSKGISIRTSRRPDDITIFLGFMHRVANRNHMTPHSDSYYRTQANTLFPLHAAKLFIAEFEGSPIAAAIAYDTETTRYYAHAAADDTYRKLAAGTALLAYMIMDAKQMGKIAFDLYGIAPPDQPHHPWAGFTKFKQSFGGTPVAHIGAWDYPLQKMPFYAYKLYQILRALHIRN